MTSHRRGGVAVETAALSGLRLLLAVRRRLARPLSVGTAREAGAGGARGEGLVGGRGEDGVASERGQGAAGIAPGAGGRRADLVAAGGAVALVAAAALTGGMLYLTGHPVRASAAPLFAHWFPHIGPGTPAAIAMAILVVWQGPAVAAIASWRRLLLASYAAATAWILALALVDGPQSGVTGRLTTPFEYLSDVDKVPNIGAMLHNFTGGIVEGWSTHVAGHPPGALLVFVALDRVGLGGGAWAAALCILGGALVAVAVPVTVRELAGEKAGRAAVPFVVLFPGAVWIGVSADGLFAGVAAVGIALLAVGGRVKSLAGGLVLGFVLFLSYGLVLLAPLALVAALRPAWRAPAAAGPIGCAASAPSAACAATPAAAPAATPTPALGGLEARARVRHFLGGLWTERSDVLLWAATGVLVVVVAFGAAGFWWWDGFELVQVRYHAGLASHRPYPYWVWANLAALTLCAGPAAAAILRRGRRFPLLLAAAAAILIADISGLSKAETERIWLPFAVWLTAAAVLLPVETRRGWLMAQAATALLVNHLFLTTW